MVKKSIRKGGEILRPSRPAAIPNYMILKQIDQSCLNDFVQYETFYEDQNKAKYGIVMVNMSHPLISGTGLEYFRYQEKKIFYKIIFNPMMCNGLCPIMW